MCGPSCDQLYDARLYEIKPKNGDDPGICGRCSELCDPSVGCRGPSPADCEQCEVGSLSLNETIVSFLSFSLYFPLFYRSAWPSVPRSSLSVGW